MKDYCKKILVVDEEIAVQQTVSIRLTIIGYKVLTTSNGKDALKQFNSYRPDLVILALLLPKVDGYEVCRKIRANSNTPIILLTNFNNISDLVIGLELGADDCLVKPFLLKELEAKVNFLFRRSNKLDDPPSIEQKKVQIGKLFLDKNKKVVINGTANYKLTLLEYRLLEMFIENKGKELSRFTILNNIWGYTPERYVDTRVVDVHVSRLRAKIEEDPKNPDLIATIRGIGYLFRD